jgi:hypothetical protein
MLNALLTVTASAVGRPPDAVPVPANSPKTHCVFVLFVTFAIFVISRRPPLRT